jgi:hypothetical protein
LNAMGAPSKKSASTVIAAPASSAWSARVAVS